jgi:hypothetical protein
MAVCYKTFQIYNREPYKRDIVPVEPYESIPLEDGAPFDCKRSIVRHPRETKGPDYEVTELSGAECCDPNGSCC